MSGIFKDIKDKMKELSDNHAIKKILAEKLRKMADKVKSYALYAMELPLVDNNSAMVKIAEQIQMAGNKNNPTDRKDTYMNVGMTRKELEDWASAYKDDGILSMAERWFIDLDINNHIPQEYRDDNWIDFLNDLKMAADYTIAKSPKKITAALDLANKADEKDKEKAVIDEIRRNIPLLVKGRFFGQKPEEKTGVALREEVAFEDQSKHFKLAAARIKVRLGDVKPKDGIKFDFVEIESNKDILNLIFQEGQDDDGKIHSSLAEVQKELQEGIAAEAERKEQELNIFKEEADEHRRKIKKAKEAAKAKGQVYHELDRQGAEINAALARDNINKNNGINNRPEKLNIEALGSDLWFTGDNHAVDLSLFSHDENGDLVVALIKRGQEPFKDSFALPGGFVNTESVRGEEYKLGYETHEDTAKREFLEETGLPISSDLTKIGYYDDPARDPRNVKDAQVVSTAYSSYVDTNEDIIGLDDASEAKWVKVSDISSGKMKLAFDHSMILNDSLKKMSNNILLGKRKNSFRKKKIRIMTEKEGYQKGDVQQCLVPQAPRKKIKTDNNPPAKKVKNPME